MMIDLSKEWDKALEKAIDVVRNNGIIVYPTDTLYGIGGNAMSKEVVERIYEIKKRPKKKALTVLVGNLNMILEYFVVDREKLKIITQYLPGPYTFILKPKIKMPVSEQNVGVRVPEHFFIRKVSIDTGVPIITTSANLSGKNPAYIVNDVDKEVLLNADLIIDGGPTKYKGPSTIVDLVDKKIIRKGIGAFELFTQ